ncbi:uncharacterized protein LOC131938289 [Physella acuta]|uniref:uncharacterized protein LOC131938289 n=1 Tax=Physella acuta TaxID=109671 RepID=UPI0027DC4097|nr:uncharacterized protein LOC131938289 [Physella acuta]
MDVLCCPHTRYCVIYFLVIYVSTALRGVGCVCDETSVTRAQECVGKFSDGSDLISGDNIQQIGYACSNGDLLTAVSCAERVLDECKHETTDHAYYLRGLFDIESQRRSVNYFCTHFKLFEKNADCISRQHTEQEVCAEEAVNNFKTQSEATSNIDALMSFQCIFFQATKKCQLDVLKSKCSSDAVDIVRIILEGFQPPICSSTVRAESRDNDSNNSSTSIALSLIVFVISLLSTIDRFYFVV